MPGWCPSDVAVIDFRRSTLWRKLTCPERLASSCPPDELGGVGNKALLSSCGVSPVTNTCILLNKVGKISQQHKVLEYKNVGLNYFVEFLPELLNIKSYTGNFCSGVETGGRRGPKGGNSVVCSPPHPHPHFQSLVVLYNNTCIYVQLSSHIPIIRR